MSIQVDIKKHFANFDLEVAFEAGSETLGFLGASGGGKSVTLRCIAGLVTPDEGKIVVNGQTFFDSAAKINLKVQERKTALLFQDYKLFPNLTVAKNVAAGLPKGLSKAEIHDQVSVQLERFGLRGYGSRYPSRLSGGQQQRVALARMLAANPGILMLDEPFSALDEHLKSGLEEDLLALFDKFDGTILYVSHDIDEAFRFCDRIAVIDNGHLAEVAPTPEIVAHPQTLATIKVSGVKNICRVKKTGPNQVQSQEWGIRLITSEPVMDDAAFIGIRATYLKPATTEQSNVYDFTVRRVSDSRFTRTVVLDPGGLVWLADKLIIPADQLPVKGQAIQLHFPPDQIYIVNR